MVSNTGGDEKFGSNLGSLVPNINIYTSGDYCSTMRPQDDNAKIPFSYFINYNQIKDSNNNNNNGFRIYNSTKGETKVKNIKMSRNGVITIN
jgi:hypothetical protein